MAPAPDSIRMGANPRPYDGKGATRRDGRRRRCNGATPLTEDYMRTSAAGNATGLPVRLSA